MWHQESFYNFLTFEKRFSANTVTAYKTDLGQFLAFLEKTYHPSNATEVSHQHIRSWIVALMQDKISPRSINRKLSCLKTWFRFLLKRGLVPANPMQKVVPPKTGKRLPSSSDIPHAEGSFCPAGTSPCITG